MNSYDILCDLAACLCAELTPQGEAEPGLCFCGVHPGEIAVADVGLNSACADGTCGMAWTRLESAYPATVVGQYEANPRAAGTYLGLDIEVGVLRCVDGGENGNPPSPAALEAAARQQMADMEAMRHAILCCKTLKEVDHLVGTYAPAGPLGLVAGGVWTVSVMI